MILPQALRPSGNIPAHYGTLIRILISPRQYHWSLGTFAQMSRGTKLAIPAGCLGILVFVFIAPPLRQDQGYHSFADGRTILGMANFWA